MSYRLYLDDVLYYQRFLKSNGFYKGKLDSDWGPKTDAADNAFVAETAAVKKRYGTFPIRSEENITTLIPQAQVAARQMVAKAVASGRDVRIISATRSYQEQNTLYRKGRYGSKEPKVTNARGGYSNHNFGLAWDIGIFENGKYITKESVYKQLAKEIMPQLGNIEWGGDWKTFKDFPHYQLKAKSTNVSTIRSLFEKGEPYV